MRLVVLGWQCLSVSTCICSCRLVSWGGTSGIALALSTQHRVTVPILWQAIPVQSQRLMTAGTNTTCLAGCSLELVLYLRDILKLPTTSGHFSLFISGWNDLSAFLTPSPPPLTCVTELNVLPKRTGRRLPEASRVVISVFSGCKKCHYFNRDYFIAKTCFQMVQDGWCLLWELELTSESRTLIFQSEQVTTF